MRKRERDFIPPADGSLNFADTQKLTGWGWAASRQIFWLNHQPVQHHRQLASLHQAILVLQGQFQVFLHSFHWKKKSEVESSCCPQNCLRDDRGPWLCGEGPLHSACHPGRPLPPASPTMGCPSMPAPCARREPQRQVDDRPASPGQAPGPGSHRCLRHIPAQAGWHGTDSALCTQRGSE